MTKEQIVSRTRSAGDIRGRIADILGYCKRDGGLHDPSEYRKKLLRSKWVCPDCGHAIGLNAYRRASELRWTLTEAPPQPEEPDREVDMEAINRELGIEEEVGEEIRQIREIISEDDPQP